MVHRSFIEKQDIFETIMRNLIVSTIPIFGFIHAWKNQELSKWFLIYLPIALVGYYLVGARGVIIDVQNNRYKIFKKLLFWDLGNWQKLPYIDRIVLKYLNQFIDTTNRRSWTKTGHREMHYKLVLLNSREDFQLVIMETKNEGLAKKLGESMARDLDIALEVLK